MARTVTFEIEDDLMPESGIALLRCVDGDGNIMIAESEFGQSVTADLIGMLQTSLDQYRYDFVDRDGRPNNEDEEPDDDSPYRRR